ATHHLPVSHFQRLLSPEPTVDAKARLNRTSAAARTTARFTASLTIIAWLLLSNRCALGRAQPAVEVSSDVCPMHSAPAKKKSAETIPCCKELRAILGKTAAHSSAAAPGFVGTREFPVRFFAPPPRVPQEVDELDTGPPHS